MNATLARAAVVVRRTIFAAPETLFDAWLDPIALTNWMHPGDTRRITATVDARVGGRFEIVMHFDASTIAHTGAYRVIDRPKRLVFTWQSAPTEQRETLVTVDFIARGRSTEIVLTHEQLPESALPSHRNGWTHALDKLATVYGAPAD